MSSNRKLGMFVRKNSVSVAPKGVEGMVQDAREARESEAWVPKTETPAWVDEAKVQRRDEDEQDPFLHGEEGRRREAAAAAERAKQLEARYGLQAGRVAMTAPTSAKEVAEAAHVLNRVLARAASPRERALAAAVAQVALVAPGAAKGLLKGMARSAGYPALDAVWMTATVEDLRQQVATLSRAGKHDPALEERMHSMERRVEEGFSVARAAGTTHRVLETLVPEEVRGTTLEVVLAIVRGRYIRRAAKTANSALLAEKARAVASAEWRKHEEVLRKSAEAILGTLEVPAGSTVLRDPAGTPMLVGATEEAAMNWLRVAPGVTRVSKSKSGDSFRVTVEVEEEGEEPLITTAKWAWDIAREVKHKGIKWLVEDGTWACNIVEVGKLPPLKDGMTVFDV